METNKNRAIHSRGKYAQEISSAKVVKENHDELTESSIFFVSFTFYSQRLNFLNTGAYFLPSKIKNTFLFRRILKWQYLYDLFSESIDKCLFIGVKAFCVMLVL